MRIAVNGSMVVELEGWERWAGFQRRIVVPREQITDVRFHEQYTDPGGVWRAAGTGLPRRLYAGHFRRGGRREFWYVRNPQGIRRPTAANVLEVVTDGPLSRLLLSTSADDAATVREWFEGPGVHQVL